MIKKLNNYAVLVLCITTMNLFLIHESLKAQTNPIKELKGYKEILMIRVNSPDEWNKNKEMYLTKLINIVVCSEVEYNIIIPLKFITNTGDTLINCYSQGELKSILKKKEIKHIYYQNSPFKGGILIKEKFFKYPFDSVYAIISKNMTINKELFEWNIYLDKTPNTGCCDYPTLMSELQYLNVAFEDGILLAEDDPSGTLSYVSY